MPASRAFEAAGACGSANHDLRKTSPLDNDTDDDGLLDGQETGMTSPVYAPG